MKNKTSLSFVFIIMLTLLQTAISLTPGILFLSSSSQGPAIVTYMIIYLLVSDFFQIFGKLAYKKGKFISLPAYAVKLGISAVLVFMIAKHTAPQFAIVLIAYELFQILIFSKQFFYIDSLLYSITNAFFKGIVFNQLLTINYPFNYQFDLMKPFIFAFFLILVLTILSQGMYSFLSKQVLFLVLTILGTIMVYYLLIQQFLGNELTLLKLILFILCHIASFYFFLRSKNAKKKELILNLFTLIGLIIYYI